MVQVLLHFKVLIRGILVAILLHGHDMSLFNREIGVHLGEALADLGSSGFLLDDQDGGDQAHHHADHSTRQGKGQGWGRVQRFLADGLVRKRIKDINGCKTVMILSETVRTFNKVNDVYSVLLADGTLCGQCCAH